MKQNLQITVTQVPMTKEETEYLQQWLYRTLGEAVQKKA